MYMPPSLPGYASRVCTVVYYPGMPLGYVQWWVYYPGMPHGCTTVGILPGYASRVCNGEYATRVCLSGVLRQAQRGAYYPSWVGKTGTTRRVLTSVFVVRRAQRGAY